jgi:hypothetical protein
MISLGWNSPWDSERPHRRQQEFLRAAFRGGNGITITHMIGGRGVSKTTSMMMALLESAVNRNQGLPHLWSAPTVDDCTMNFLQRWEEYVPPDLYSQEKAKRIIWVRNSKGSSTPIYYRGRDISNQKKEKGRGPEWAFVAFDELRQDPTDKEWKVILPSVRHPKAKQLIVVTGSTPIKNWFYHMVKSTVESGAAIEINGTSWDNPYQDGKNIEIQMADCDPLWARQEHYGEWISLGSQVWYNANLDQTKNWPHSNWHPHTFDRSLPFTVGCDLGVRSGWIIWQHVSGYPGMMDSQTVDVAVAEFTPNDGDTEKVTAEITAEYGFPMRVICGSDLDTRSITNGQTSAMIFRDAGWLCSIVPVRGKLAAKDLQYLATKRCLENALHQRTMCISRGIMTHEPHHRGIVDVLNLDSWPEKCPRSGEFLPKDKSSGGPGLEDIRDAMMYSMTYLHPIRGNGAGLMRRDAA